MVTPKGVTGPVRPGEGWPSRPVALAAAGLWAGWGGDRVAPGAGHGIGRPGAGRGGGEEEGRRQAVGTSTRSSPRVQARGESRQVGALAASPQGGAGVGAPSTLATGCRSSPFPPPEPGESPAFQTVPLQGRGAAPRSRGSEPVPVPLGGSQARGQLCPLAAPSPGPGDPCPHWGPGAAVLTAALLSVGPLCAPSSPSQGGAEGPSGAVKDRTSVHANAPFACPSPLVAPFAWCLAQCPPGSQRRTPMPPWPPVAGKPGVGPRPSGRGVASLQETKGWPGLENRSRRRKAFYREIHSPLPKGPIRPGGGADPGEAGKIPQLNGALPTPVMDRATRETELHREGPMQGAGGARPGSHGGAGDRQGPGLCRGEIEFGGSGKKRGKFVKLPSGVAPSVLFDLLLTEWHLPAPNLVVSLVGEERPFALKPWLRDVLRKGLVKAAQSTREAPGQGLCPAAR
ncbi:hypothetical protein J1605_002364 [Eschrichtius robustus]|uniref:TRPM SLOG domain-containing protein n=1 Tax=Eschrichtius robustus TaxID=9764 RepID=A0AB34HRW2_ESCRO|nr:hypothetical protein J1605_002364 [Eschrichtius robustus]